MSTGKTKNGTWYASVRYTDWTGKRVQKKKSGFKLEREAKQWEKEFLAKQTLSPDMTFQSLYELYIDDCKQRLKPTTLYTKQGLFKNRILPYFKDRKINEIKPVDIRNWQNAIMTPHNGKKFVPTYLRVLNQSLSTIFNFAIKYYGLQKNPVRIAGTIGKPKRDSMQFWTVQEFNTFKNALSPQSTAYLIFTLLFYTGMRIGELRALTFADIDETAKTIRINKTYARINRTDYIQSPKTAKSNRTIPIPPFLVDMIKEYKKTLYKPKNNERIFEFSKTWLNKTMKNACLKAGVKKIRIHDLRHSHASLLIDMGFSPLLIRERLGHEDIQTTLNTYSHLYPNKQDVMIAKLEALSHEERYPEQ